jgi:hypothetical protein
MTQSSPSNNKDQAMTQSSPSNNKDQAMTKVYTKSENKSSSKYEKNSEKEILDKEIQFDISLTEARRYQGYRRIIPAHIADDRSLTDPQKMLYGLLDSLSHNEKHPGYCFARNEILCLMLNWKLRFLQKNLNILMKKGLIIVEVSQAFYHKSIRKIWTLDQFAIRNRLEEIYGKEKLNKRFYMDAQPCMTSCTAVHTEYRKDIPISKNNTKVPEKRKPDRPKPTPPPSAIIPLFCYEWKNRSTDTSEKIENGVTLQELERLKSQIGEAGIRSVCNNMKKWADDSNGKVLFKNRNLYKKILDWHAKSLLASEEKAQIKKEKALREGKKPVGTPEEKLVDEAETFIEEFIKENPDLADGIKWNKELKCVKIKSIINDKLFDSIYYPRFDFYERLLAWGRAKLINNRKVNRKNEKEREFKF